MVMEPMASSCPCMCSIMNVSNMALFSPCIQITSAAQLVKRQTLQLTCVADIFSIGESISVRFWFILAYCIAYYCLPNTSRPMCITVRSRPNIRVYNQFSWTLKAVSTLNKRGMIQGWGPQAEDSPEQNQHGGASID